MHAGGDEHAVQALRAGAVEIGADAVADAMRVEPRDRARVARPRAGLPPEPERERAVPGQIVRGQPGPYGINYWGNAAIYAGTIFPLSVTTKMAAPDLRLGSDCECRGLGLGNLAGKFIQF